MFQLGMEYIKKRELTPAMIRFLIGEVDMIKDVEISRLGATCQRSTDVRFEWKNKNIM